MSRAIEELKSENAALQEQLQAMEAKAARAGELERQLEILSAELAWFRRYFMGRKSDTLRVDTGQGALPFDEAEMLVDEQPESTEEQQKIGVGSYTKRKPVRMHLSNDLPRVEVLVDIEESEKECACGAHLVRIGEETSEKLDIEPPRLRVIREVRPKWACRACEGSADEEKPAVRIAAPLAALIPTGIASAGLLAYVITAKFVDGLPLYRQEKQFSRIGVNLSRRTMADWMVSVAGSCVPVYQALENRLRAGPAVQLDETTVQVMREPERANTAKSYAWVARGGDPEHPVIVYRYEPTRSGHVAQQILGAYRGYVQTDGYTGYDWSLEELEGVIHVGCLAHVRRKFVDAANIGTGGGSAREAVALIAKIYAVEKRLAERPRDAAFAAERAALTRPLLEKLSAWVAKKSAHVPPQTALGKAVTYAHQQLPKVARYLESEHLGPDTNAVENAIRPFVLGRKSWLFSGSPRGAHSSMTLYSLVETARANRVEPYRYLRELFDRLPTFDRDGDYAQLLPWNIFTKED